MYVHIMYVLCMCTAIDEGVALRTGSCVVHVPGNAGRDSESPGLQGYTCSP